MGIQELLIELKNIQEKTLKTHLPLSVYRKYVKREIVIDFLDEYLNEEASLTIKDRIFRLLKDKGPLSRMDIAAALKINPVTVTYYTRDCNVFVKVSRGVIGLKR